RLVLTGVVRLALEVGVGEIGAEGGDRGQRGAVGVEVVGQVVGLLELVLASLDTGEDGSARIQTELLCMLRGVLQLLLVPPVVQEDRVGHAALLERCGASTSCWKDGPPRAVPDSYHWTYRPLVRSCCRKSR